MRKRNLLGCVLPLLVSSCFLFNSVGKNKIDDVVVLYTNDTHCAVEDGIGFKGLAAVKSALENEGKTVFVFDCGDAIQGDTIGTISNGSAIVDIMNSIPYDAATLGNHEFDYGLEVLRERISQAKFKYVSCNFVDKSGATFVPAYTIIKKGDVKVAVVGVSTPLTITTSTPAYFTDNNGNFIWGFGQTDLTGRTVYSAVNKAAEQAKAEGADLVVALAHLGIETDCSPWTCPEVIAATKGIDVFLDGHSHSIIPQSVVKNSEGKEVVHSQTGTKFETIGMITFENGKPHTSLVKPDEAVSTVKKALKTKADLVNKEIAKSSVNMVINDPATNKRIIRTRETNLGDFCADAYRAITEADVALVNGGGIRAAINKGVITYDNLISVQPYGNMLCKVEATGQQILDALELGASNLPGESGGFLQVSGLTYEVNTAIPSPVQKDANKMFTGVSGTRRVENVMVAGKPIDPKKTYTVASHNYLLKNAGDGYTMFQKCKVLLDEIMLDNQVLITYLTKYLNGNVGSAYQNTYGTGRITIK